MCSSTSNSPAAASECGAKAASSSVAQTTGSSRRVRALTRAGAAGLDHDRRKACALQAERDKAVARADVGDRTGRREPSDRLDDQLVAVLEPERVLLDAEAERVGLVGIVDSAARGACQIPSASRCRPGAIDEVDRWQRRTCTSFEVCTLNL